MERGDMYLHDDMNLVKNRMLVFNTLLLKHLCSYFDNNLQVTKLPNPDTLFHSQLWMKHWYQKIL